MDGEKESETTTDIVKKIDDALANYEKGIGLNKYVLHSDAEKYLNMSHTELRKLSAEESGEAAILLAQMSYNIQKYYNEEMARVTWCDETIKRSITGQTMNYKGASFEERKMAAVKDNDYARKLDTIKSWAKSRADRLSYLSSRLEFLAKTLLEYQQTKRRKEYKSGEF